ncbi:hypothetical protein D3C75_925010 [compost metagenome]
MAWRSRPCVIRIAARAITPPVASEMFPASWTLAIPSAKVRCAVSKSPLVQDASPRSAVAAPRGRWSSSVTRSSTCRAYFKVLGRSPSACACAARYTAIEHGRRRNSSSFTTIISVNFSGCSFPSTGTSSHCSASPSLSSAASNSPPASSAQA